jgi:acyl-CoA synthetase (NDP forming)
MIPLYAFPESAVRALNGMIRYANIRKKNYEEPRKFFVHHDEAEKILVSAAQEKRRSLNQQEIQKLLSIYGIPLAPLTGATSAKEAAQNAKSIGFPLVMKAKMKTRSHKSDFGGVIVDLRNEPEVEEAYQEMRERIRKAGLEQEWLGVDLQAMVKGGKEVIIGVSDDPMFGSLLMVGLGGIYVETLKDTIFRAVPVTKSDAIEMIQSLKGYPLLKGVRGEQAVDLEFLAEILQRVSQMVTDFPAIKELEMNPFMITPDRNRSMAVDVRIYL